MASPCSARSEPPAERDRDTESDITSGATDAQRTAVARVNCFDAGISGRATHLIADEERWLRNTLAARCPSHGKIGGVRGRFRGKSVGHAAAPRARAVEA